MRKNANIFCAAALMSVLCVGFVACNETNGADPWLGEDIPGMEIHQATGTVIGSYSNGFISLLVQVDDEYPIGEPIEHLVRSCTNLPSEGTYKNMIQVQQGMPVEIGRKISFSVREFNAEKDFELFERGPGNALCVAPSVPVFVITKYKKLND